MRRSVVLLAGMAVFLAISDRAMVTAASSSYSPAITGSIQGYRLAGVEPDGDPLYQVVLQTKLPASAGNPTLNLIVDSFMENFRPDTTPILPDLLHPNRTATNLGGFLQGKVLLVDDAGNVLSIGSFVTEAFLDNSNHTVITLLGSGSPAKTIGKLTGIFRLSGKQATLSGQLSGHLQLSAAIRRQIAEHRGAAMKPLTKIISQVTVVPHYMGAHVKGHGSVLHTGFGSTGSAQTPPATGTPTSRHISPWTILAGIGAIVSLLLAGILFWIDRRRTAHTPSVR
jgi:hypothetical protein